MKEPSRRPPLLLRLAAMLLPADAREEVLGDLMEAWEIRRRAEPGHRRLGWLLRQPLAALRARGVGRAGTASTGSGMPDPAPGMPRIPRRRSLAFSILDVRLALRMLGKQPVLTVVAGLTLGLGIPASLIPVHVLTVFETASFPVEDGDRIVGLRNWSLETNRPAGGLLRDFAVWRSELRAFESIGAAASRDVNVHSADGSSDDVRGAVVSASVFDMLRVPPLLGRTLVPADEVEGAEDVVVISEDLWNGRFARDPDIIGRTIGVGRTSHTIVGVMPRGFLFPWADHLWTPLKADPDDYAVGSGPDIMVFGRLEEGVSLDEARVELETVGARLAQDWPETHGRVRPEIVSVSILAFGEPAWGLSMTWEMLLIQLVCLALLMVACGNVGVLILARTATRTREIAVRTALGASRPRILSQLFVESLVLALGATGLGLLVAHQAAVRYAEVLVSGSWPYWFDLGLGVPSILFALTLAAVCAVVAGVLPAIRATSPRIQRTLQRNAAGTSVRFGGFTAALVVAEVAISMASLSVGTALVVSFVQDRTDEAGIDVDRYLTADILTPWFEPTEDEAATHRADFLQRIGRNHLELRDLLRAEGDVRRVAMGSHVPGIPHSDQAIEIRGREATDSQLDRVLAGRVHVDFFRDLGIRVLSGRDFSLADVEAGPVPIPPWAIPRVRKGEAPRPAVVVNDQFVDSVLGGGDAIGLQLRYTFDESDVTGMEAGVQDYNVWYEIVGVVETYGTNMQNPARGAAVFHPVSASEALPMRFIMEVAGDPSAFIPRLRQLAARVDPELVVRNPLTLREVVEGLRTQSTLVTLFIVLLSATGIILASTGLYALVSFTVSQRTREIGIRTALGAGARNVVATIAQRALQQLVAGIALGCLTAWALLGLMADESEFAVSSVPGLLAAVSVAVLLVAGVACLKPTLRGLRIEPTEALRES